MADSRVGRGLSALERAPKIRGGIGSLPEVAAPPGPYVRLMTRQIERPGPLVTIRVAAPDDAEALHRLAELDSARPPTGRVLVAEQDGEPVGAISLGAGSVVADPVQPSADAVHMLRLRRYQLLHQGGDVGRAPSLLRRMLPRTQTR